MADATNEVRKGLSSKPKYLPHWYRYDTQGSVLSDQTLDDERYYFHRAEEEVLRGHAREIVNQIASPCTLTDMGCGNAVKTRIIIDAILERQSTLTFIPVDISAEFLREVCKALSNEYKDKLIIKPVFGDYTDGFKRLGSLTEANLVLWFGSLQNESWDDQITFLKSLSSRMKENDRLILTLDITDDVEAIQQAYGEGLCGAFNKNSLTRLNRELGNGLMDESRFLYKFEYVQNSAENQPSFTSPYFESLGHQDYYLAKLDLRVTFEPGERLYLSKCQGLSHKYTEAQLSHVINKGHHVITRRWTDKNKHVALLCLKAGQ